MAPPPLKQAHTPATVIGWGIFASRWIQAPLYIGLIAAQAVYVVKFWRELVHLVFDFGTLDENDVMLVVLGLVDVVMIANLLIMVIIGGYETFVSRIRQVSNHPDQPEWLSHVNANVLKVKLAMAIVGISSIHLLKTFIEYGTENTGSHRDRGHVADDHPRRLRPLGDRSGLHRPLPLTGQARLRSLTGFRRFRSARVESGHARSREDFPLRKGDREVRQGR